MSGIELEPNDDDRQIETGAWVPATAAQEEWRSQQEAKARKRAERLGIDYVPWSPPVARPPPPAVEAPPGQRAAIRAAYSERDSTLHLTTAELAAEIASGRRSMPNRPSSLCRDGWCIHEAWQASR